MHIHTEIFAHSSLQNSSSLVWSDGECQWTAIFKFCQRFSIGFRSKLWLGHSNTWICFGLNQGCPTFFDPRSTFQVTNLPRSTCPVSISQTHTHRFQPAVSNLTTLFVVVTQPLDITSQTLPHTHKPSHTHTYTHTHTPVCVVRRSTLNVNLLKF